MLILDSRGNKCSMECHMYSWLTEGTLYASKGQRTCVKVYIQLPDTTVHSILITTLSWARLWAGSGTWTRCTISIHLYSSMGRVAPPQRRTRRADWRGCHMQLAGTGAAKTNSSISAAQMAPKESPSGCHFPGWMGFYTLSWGQSSILTTQGSCLQHPVRKLVPQQGFSPSWI